MYSLFVTNTKLRPVYRPTETGKRLKVIAATSCRNFSARHDQDEIYCSKSLLIMIIIILWILPVWKSKVWHE